MALIDKLTAIGDAIRSKTGKTESLTLDQMATEIAGIETGGGSGGSGENLLAYARNVSSLFESATLPENVNFVLGEVNAGVAHNPAMTSAFYLATGVKNIKFDIAYEVSNLALNSTFRGCSAEILEIPFAEKACVTNWNRAFQSMSNLKEIKTPLNLMIASNVNTIFTSATALEEVRFVPGTIKISISINSCANLTSESIQSIIDGLADLTGGTAQTLTLSKTVGAKLTDAQKASASAKNWTISY